MKTRRCPCCFHELPEKRNTFRPRWSQWAQSGEMRWTYFSDGPELGYIRVNKQSSGLNYGAWAINEYPKDHKAWPERIWLDTFRLISNAKREVENHIYEKGLWP